MAYGNYHTRNYKKQMDYHDKNILPVQKFFEAKGCTVRIPNTANSTQRRIHLFVRFPDGTEKSCSIKADRWIASSGNLYLEETLHHKIGYGTITNELGWVMQTDADWVLYIDTITKKMYTFDWPQLKKFLKENKHDSSLFQHNLQESRFDRGTTVEVYIAKLDMLRAHGLVLSEDELDES